MKRLLMLSAAFALTAVASVGTASSDDCPPAREYSDMCIQMIVWAKNPETGQCCGYYPTPCSAPAGWQTYPNPDCTYWTIEL
jgi:hypothetical protein